MVISGHVNNGVIVLDGGLKLPEGLHVTVSIPDQSPARRPKAKLRVQLPLVKSDQPGSLNLTNERIAEILDDDDVPT